MYKDTIYYKQVQLLLRVLPFIAKEDCFALKGGTAINLFVRDFPRLSVDIDLVYLPVKDRNNALSDAGNALDRIKLDIESSLKDIKVIHTENKEDVLRLIAMTQSQDIRIKIELSPVMRGVVYPPKLMSVDNKVEDEFGYTEINVTSFEDLYAGKICAALDRQHPRDLFDVKLLLENEGISDNLYKAFLVYLISHNRPIHELLNPEFKTNFEERYNNEFLNMTNTGVSCDELERVFKKLVSIIQGKLTDEYKKFLISFKSLSPEWDLLGLDGAKDLPAVKWKLINLQNMNEEKRQAYIKNLIEVMG